MNLSKKGVEILQQLDYPEAYLLALDSLIVNAYFQNRWEQFKITQLMLRPPNKYNDKWMIAFALFAVSMAEIDQRGLP